MQFKSFFVLIIFILSSFLFAEDEEVVVKTRVGVINFTAKNTSTMEADIVTDMFRNEIVDSGKFEVLDRNNMQQIMNEQSFQQSGCTDSECAVQIGRILNMEHMIIGVFMKAGENYFVSTEMISVETGKIDKSARVDFDDMNELETAVIELSEQLTGIKKKQDLDKFRVFSESKYIGFMSFMGGARSEAFDQNRYENSFGADAFWRFRLFGTDKDVLKWSGFWGLDFAKSTINWDNHSDDRRMTEASSAYWISTYLSPFTSVTMRVGKTTLLSLGGKMSYLYLIEKATINGADYTNRFGFFGLGTLTLVEFGRKFGGFIKIQFDYYLYPQPEDAIDTGDIKYHVSRQNIGIGVKF